jgi:uncharacterized membrane protein
MFHYFDLKVALLAKHAQHIVVIHFPIALFCAAFLFDLAGYIRRRRLLTMVAYYNLIFAAAASLAAAGTGIAAWQLIYDGGPLRGVLLYHLVSAVLTVCGVCGLALYRFRLHRTPDEQPGRVYLGLAFAVLLGVVITAHLGGILSGVVPLAD